MIPGCRYDDIGFLGEQFMTLSIVRMVLFKSVNNAIGID